MARDLTPNDLLPGAVPDDRSELSDGLDAIDGLDPSMHLLLLGSIANSIVISDATQPDHPIIYVNPAFERATGYRQAEVQGRNCRFLQGPDTDRAAVATMREALSHGQGCAVTILNYRKDGSPFWQELTLSPVRDLSGRLVHIVGIQADLTVVRRVEERERGIAAERLATTEERERFAEEERRLTEHAKHLAEESQQLAEARLSLAEERGQRAEEARRHAEGMRVEAEGALRLKNDVLAMVAHDLRSPLTALRGRLEIVQRRITRGREITGDWLDGQVTPMIIAATRMGDTLDEVMDVAQLWIGQPLVLHLGPVAMHSLVQEVMESFALRDGAPPITFAAPTVTDAVFTIRADAARLARVMQNIIGNAVKYGNGNAVAVAISEDTAADTVTITVRDKGVGIATADQAQVFTRYYRAGTALGIAGMGIGLAGAKSIVEQHGGTITLVSTVGVGTVVTVTLPCGLSPETRGAA